MALAYNAYGRLIVEQSHEEDSEYAAQSGD
jgi:hypothetical protein